MPEARGLYDASQLMPGVAEHFKQSETGTIGRQAGRLC